MVLIHTYYDTCIRYILLIISNNVSLEYLIRQVKCYNRCFLYSRLRELENKTSIKCIKSTMSHHSISSRSLNQRSFYIHFDLLFSCISMSRKMPTLMKINLPLTMPYCFNFPKFPWHCILDFTMGWKDAPGHLQFIYWRDKVYHLLTVLSWAELSSSNFGDSFLIFGQYNSLCSPSAKCSTAVKLVVVWDYCGRASGWVSIKTLVSIKGNRSTSM